MLIVQGELFEVKKISNEERWFLAYVNELLEGGWLKEAAFQPESFQVYEGGFTYAYQGGKDTNDMVDVKLVSPHRYTADFKFVWNKKAHNVFYWNTGGVYKKNFFPYRKSHADNFVPFYASTINGEMTSYIDTKGAFGQGRNNVSASTFPMKQAMMLMTQEIFVQKVVVSLDEKSVFAKTFTPRSIIVNEVYKRDCKNGKKGDSKLKYSPRILEQYLGLKKKLIAG